MSLSDKIILKGLLEKESLLTNEIAEKEEELRKTRLAIEAFSGNKKPRRSIKVKAKTGRPPIVVSHANGESWKSKVIIALKEIKTGTPVEIIEHIQKSNPDKTWEQVRKRVQQVLPKLESARDIKFDVISGTKRRRKKYYI